MRLCSAFFWRDNLNCWTHGAFPRVDADPNAFKDVHLYRGFAAYGFVEGKACSVWFFSFSDELPVVENAFRTIVRKCHQDVSQLYAQLLPLSVFFVQRAKEASASIPGDNFEVVDNLVDVLCNLWQAAVSVEDRRTLLSSEAWDHCSKFRQFCIDDLEMYADWSWMDPYEGVPVDGVVKHVQDAVFAHLESKYAWQKGDSTQLLQRQSEFLVR